MNRFYITLLSLLISLSTNAQSNKGFRIGLNLSYTMFGASSDDLVNNAIGLGGAPGFRMLFSGEHFEFCTGLDIMASGTKAAVNNTANKPINPPMQSHTLNLSGPATRIVPVFAFNYIHNKPKNEYVFAGVFSGIGMGTWRGDQMFAVMPGLQLGYVFTLSKKLGLEVSENWRTMRLDDIYYEDSSGGVNVGYAPVRFNYFMTTVGLRFR